MDALSLLGHIVQDHNQIRRDSLKVDLNLQYKKLCNPSHNTDTGSSKWLFGDELGKRVKDIKETNQVGSSVASGSRLYKSVSRFNSRSKPFLSQGNSHYKRPPQNQNRIKIKIGELIKQSRPGFHQSELCFKGFAPDRRLCLPTVYLEYIKRTANLRGSECHLFISYIKPYKTASIKTRRKSMQKCAF
ncbi:hypothetical protein LOTGIDRAFT_175946 [Lottia gigantea]|uniref:Uncharacterized protein n=1 Tax=Lottia gigantea TaxID=225164 RepID=V3ZTD7_LOTGI|nr:hypothetical protein LOTGIDRAFT_175946 [Lottia gigantea]ESO87632.1 hypothetical protein LOTGIDRAFT_175946 [Lottia gigantea]